MQRAIQKEFTESTLLCIAQYVRAGRRALVLSTS
jgi:hypothetical protein